MSPPSGNMLLKLPAPTRANCVFGGIVYCQLIHSFKLQAEGFIYSSALNVQIFCINWNVRPLHCL